MRRNGRFKLEVVAHPEYGLPFGQDRLIPLWVSTLAVRQKSRTVLFRSAAEILEEFDLPKDGPHYRRLVEGFKRIFTSTIYFGTESLAGRHEIWDSHRVSLFRPAVNLVHSYGERRPCRGEARLQHDQL